MLICRKSIYTENINEMFLPLTQLEVRDWLDGEKTAFELFPFLSPMEMDFLITGISPEERDEILIDAELELATA